MPQFPTSESSSQGLINKFIGLNDIKDSVKRPAGSTTDERNMWDQNTGDVNRRPGRDFDSLQSDAVNIVYQLTWDDGNITTITGGSTLSYSAFTASKGPINPFDPVNVPPLPTGPPGGSVGFLIEPTMRAMSERSARVGFSLLWPHALFDVNGNAIDLTPPATQPLSAFFTSGVGNIQWPPNNFYQYDLFWYDRKHGVAAGTRAAQLVNSIRTNLNDTITNASIIYIKDIDGLASIVFYTSANLPTPAIATAGDYAFRLNDLKLVINKLTKFGVGGVLLNLSVRRTSDFRSPPACFTVQSFTFSASSVTAYGNFDSYTNELLVSSTPITSIRMAAYFYSAGSTIAESSNVKGNIFSDLSDFPNSGTATVYLQLQKTAPGSAQITFGNSPLVASPNVYLPYSGVTPVLNSIWTSATFNDVVPSIAGACGTDDGAGWQLPNDSFFIKIIIQPTMVNLTS